MEEEVMKKAVILFVGGIASASLWVPAAITWAATPVQAATQPLPMAALDALTQNGTPLAHAQVLLFANIPQQTSTDPLAIGQTNAQGQVNVIYQPTASVIHAAQHNHGQVNFTVVVTQKNHQPDVYAFTQNLFGSPKVLATTAPAIKLQPRGRTAMWMTGRRALVQRETAQSTLTSSSSAVTMHSINPQAYCGYIQSLDGTTTSYTKIGELHNSGDASADFIYGSTADSTIGVGYSTGSTGPWSLDGSSGIANTQSAYVEKYLSPGQWANQGYQLLSDFSYERIYFQSACGDNTAFPPYYLVKATAWDGGLILGQNVSSEPPPNQYTNTYVAGTLFGRSSHTAYNYGGAFHAFGASLTAQSGFSQYVKESWHFYGYTQYLWGNNNFPNHATIIYAGNHN